MSEMLKASSTGIEPTAGCGARIRADFIGGMGKIGDRLVLMLDIEKVLSVDEIATLATANPSKAKATEAA